MIEFVAARQFPDYGLRAMLRRIHGAPRSFPVNWGVREEKWHLNGGEPHHVRGGPGAISDIEKRRSLLRCSGNGQAIPDEVSTTAGSASVEVSPRSAISFAAILRRMRRMIPTGFWAGQRPLDIVR